MSHHLSSFASPRMQEPCSISLWINHGQPVMAQVIMGLWDEDVNAAPHDRVLNRLVVTHQDERFSGFANASYCEVESQFESPEAYVAWALGFAEKHQINTMFPGRYAEVLIAHEAAFRALGVTLMYACDPSVCAIIDERPALYHRLRMHLPGVIPNFETWKDDYTVGLDEVVGRLEATIHNPAPGHGSVCVMPAMGDIGKRFFQFVEHVDVEQQLERPEQRVIKLGDFGKIAHTLAQRNLTTNQWVVMEFMPGVYYTVDCLAMKGEVVAHVILEKQAEAGSGYKVIKDDFLLLQVNRIATSFGLSGMFSAKFLVDGRGCIKLLSVNPRFSSEIGMSTLAGVNLPWLWLKLHASEGCYAVIPEANVGLRVDTVLCSIILTEKLK